LHANGRASRCSMCLAEYYFPNMRARLGWHLASGKSAACSLGSGNVVERARTCAAYGLREAFFAMTPRLLQTPNEKGRAFPRL
jgi:hypothetical protein